MIIKIDYNLDKNIVSILSDEKGYEWDQVCYLISGACMNAKETGNYIEMPWHEFLHVKNDVVRLVYDIYNVKIELTDNVSEQLKKNKRLSYETIVNIKPPTIEELNDKLSKAGFQRDLTDMQKRNLLKIVNLPAGATFSVPGAGKTTEALAFYFYNANFNDCLLVVAPKNALEAWNEQLDECVGVKNAFVRLRGGKDKIEELLSKIPQYIIISYQQFILVKDVIRKYISKTPMPRLWHHHK